MGATGSATSAASNSEEDKGYGEVEQKTSSRENVSDVEMQASSGSSSEMEPSSWMMEWQGGLHECSILKVSKSLLLGIELQF